MSLTIAACIGLAFALLAWRPPVRPLVDLSAWGNLLNPRQEANPLQNNRRPPALVSLVPPALTSLIRSLRQRTLTGVDPLTRLLMNAQLDELMSPEQFIGLRIVGPMGLGGILGTAYLLNPAPFRLVLAFVGAGIGLALPDHWLKQQVRKQQRAIRRELPSVLTTLGVLLDAGMNLVPALKEIVVRRRGSLPDVLKIALRKIELGTPFEEAMHQAAERCGVQEFTVFVSVLSQSMSKGASGVSEAVRDQSRQMWKLRQQHVQEMGHELSQDLMMILMFLAFPAIAVFLLGPAGLSVYKMLVK